MGVRTQLRISIGRWLFMMDVLVAVHLLTNIHPTHSVSFAPRPPVAVERGRRSHHFPMRGQVRGGRSRLGRGRRERAAAHVREPRFVSKPATHWNHLESRNPPTGSIPSRNAGLCTSGDWEARESGREGFAMALGNAPYVVHAAVRLQDAPNLLPCSRLYHTHPRVPGSAHRFDRGAAQQYFVPRREGSGQYRAPPVGAEHYLCVCLLNNVPQVVHLHPNAPNTVQPSSCTWHVGRPSQSSAQPPTFADGVLPDRHRASNLPCMTWVGVSSWAVAFEKS